MFKKGMWPFLIKTGSELALPGYDVAGEAPSHSLGWRLLSYVINDVISAQTTSLLAFFLDFQTELNFVSTITLYVCM